MIRSKFIDFCVLYSVFCVCLIIITLKQKENDFHVVDKTYFSSGHIQWLSIQFFSNELKFLSFSGFLQLSSDDQFLMLSMDLSFKR